MGRAITVILKVLYPKLNNWLDDSIIKLGSPKTGNECPNQLSCKGHKIHDNHHWFLRCRKPFMSSQNFDV